MDWLLKAWIKYSAALWILGEIIAIGTALFLLILLVYGYVLKKKGKLQ